MSVVVTLYFWGRMPDGNNIRQGKLVLAGSGKGSYAYHRREGNRMHIGGSVWQTLITLQQTKSQRKRARTWSEVTFKDLPLVMYFCQLGPASKRFKIMTLAERGIQNMSL